MKITGKLIEVMPSEFTPDKKHESQELVVETVSGTYPESIAVKFWNKEMTGLTEKEIGMNISFDLKTKVNKGSNGKNYNNLSGRNCHLTYAAVQNEPIQSNFDAENGAAAPQSEMDLPF